MALLTCIQLFAKRLSWQTDSHGGQRTRHEEKTDPETGVWGSPTDSVIELFILYSFCTILIKKKTKIKKNKLKNGIFIL